jgi:hypothetical protein
MTDQTLLYCTAPMSNIAAVQYLIEQGAGLVCQQRVGNAAPYVDAIHRTLTDYSMFNKH